jgi:uncharacterized membrane protein YdbT with pleckstrin-like domain
MPEDRDLIPGETILLHVNKHILVLVRRVLVPSLVALAIMVGLALLPLGSPLRDLKWFVILLVLLALFVYLDIQYIIWRSESYTISDQRVLLRRGVIGKFSRSIGIGRVQDVTTSQGLLGRVFDYGTVEIESAGKDGAEVLAYVPDPQDFRNVLLEQLHPLGGPQGASL